MQKSKIILSTLLVFAAFLLSSCTAISNETADGKLKVLVTVPPQKEFVEAIAGDEAEVILLVPPNHNPETYEPTVRQLAAVAKTDVYFMNGFLPVESVMMDKVLAVNPKLKLIDTSVGIEVMEFSAEEGRDGGENHEEEDEHLHEDGIDPHFWTSPELVKQQLTNIEAGLIELNPENATTYKQNALNYLTKLDQMQSELAATLSPYEGKIMLVYHPAFGYFAREFGLRQVFFEFEGREPSLADYTRLIEEVDQEQVKVLFIQKQHNTEAANKIADEFGLAVVVVDPLAENYLENMQVLTAIISESL